MSSFGSEYSRYYDLLYSDKDYEKECDYLQTLFRRYSKRKVRRVLDVACGTGGHALPLARRGYEVFARDLSAGMIGAAQVKARAAGLAERVSFERGDMRDLEGVGKFDVCLCMFASIGYLSRLEETLGALTAIGAHTRTGGLVVFDCWNGLAVVSVRPSSRVKKAGGGNLTVVRSATPRLDVLHNLCKVTYNMSIQKRGRKIDRFSEIHFMRYFYPGEITLLAKLANLELASFHPFLEPNRSVNERDWNVSVVARAL